MPVYFKNISNISKNIKIAYVIALTAFFIMLAISIVVFYDFVVPSVVTDVNIIIYPVSAVVVGGFSAAVCSVMKNAVILPERDIRAPNEILYHLKQIIVLLLYILLINFGLSLLGGFSVASLLTVLTPLRESNLPLFCALVKIPLFLAFLLILFLLMRRNGSSSGSVKTFNPHFLLISLILSFAFMLPATVSGYMYRVSDITGGLVYSARGARMAESAGKIYYDLQTVFAQNIDLHRNETTINEEFSIVWVLFSIILAVAIQIAAAMFGYYAGRKKYYIRFPSIKKAELDTPSGNQSAVND
jgi:hypothetical protein